MIGPSHAGPLCSGTEDGHSASQNDGIRDCRRSLAVEGHTAKQRLPLSWHPSVGTDGTYSGQTTERTYNVAETTEPIIISSDPLHPHAGKGHRHRPREVRRVRTVRPGVPRGRPGHPRRQGRSRQEGLLRRAGGLPAGLPPGCDILRQPPVIEHRVRIRVRLRIPVAHPARPRAPEMGLLPRHDRHRGGLHRVRHGPLQVGDGQGRPRDHRMPQAGRPRQVRQGPGHPEGQPRRRGPRHTHGGPLLPRAHKHRQGRGGAVRQGCSRDRDHSLPRRVSAVRGASAGARRVRRAEAIVASLPPGTGPRAPPGSPSRPCRRNRGARGSHRRGSSSPRSPC